MSNEVEWNVEGIDNNCWRVKVLGGWLVGHTTNDGVGITTESMVFVPDRMHEWQIKKPQEPEAPTVNLSDFNPELF